MRIVSLACSNTEILAALDAAGMLVGVDSHSDYPAAALRDLPRLGPDLEIDVAAVAELEPDLVLASLTVPGHETVVEGVEAAGLPVLTLAPEALDDVPASVRQVADRIGHTKEGEALADELIRAFRPSPTDRAPAGRSDIPTRPSILIQWWPDPVIAPGRRSWIHDLLESAGATHPLAAEDVLSRPMEPAEIRDADPDAIVMAWCGVDPAKYRPDVLYRNPEYRDLRAVRNGQIHRIPEAWLGRPGPRLVNGLAALREIARTC